MEKVAREGEEGEWREKGGEGSREFIREDMYLVVCVTCFRFRVGRNQKFRDTSRCRRSHVASLFRSHGPSSNRFCHVLPGNLPWCLDTQRRLRFRENTFGNRFVKTIHGRLLYFVRFFPSSCSWPYETNTQQSFNLIYQKWLVIRWKDLKFAIWLRNKFFRRYFFYEGITISIWFFFFRSRLLFHIESGN